MEVLFKCDRTAERLADFALSRLQSAPMCNTTAGSLSNCAPSGPV